MTESNIEKIINFLIKVDIDNTICIIRFKILKDIFGYKEGEICEKVYKLKYNYSKKKYYINNVQFIDELVYYNIEIKKNNIDFIMVINIICKDLTINTFTVPRSLSPFIIEYEKPKDNIISNIYENNTNYIINIFYSIYKYIKSFFTC